MVKLFVLPCFLLLATWVACQSQDSVSYYDSRYDYIDVDAIMDNKRLVKNYVDCLLNQKPCSPDGKALKRILPEGLRTKCARCSPRQKHTALAILRRLRQEYPDEWTRLGAKWDPTGDFTRRFEGILDTDDNNRIDTPVFVPTQAATTTTTFTTTNTPEPSIVNRFGDENDDEPQGLPSNGQPTVRQVTNTPVPTRMTTTSPPKPVTTATTREEPAFTSRPTKTTNRPKTRPSRIPDYAPPTNVVLDFRPIYTGTMGLIDHFGYKIIRTTELVTDLLKNTVRAVVG